MTSKSDANSPREESGAHRGRLAAVDGLRGFAVLVVLIFHASKWGGQFEETRPILGLGRAGVDLFLVLSGFCLFWPLVKRADGQVKPLNLPDYARRRVRRIGPPYIAALIFATLTCYLTYRLAGPSFWGAEWGFQDLFPSSRKLLFENLALHATLLHGFSNRFAHGIEGAFWSLSLEWQFYFLLPILVIIARRRGVYAAVAVTFITVIAYRTFLHFFAPTLSTTPRGYELSPARWAEFGTGMLAAYFLATPMSRTAKVAGNGLPLIIALAAAIFLEHRKIIQSRDDMSLSLICAWAVAFGLLLFQATRPGSWLGTIFSARPLVLIGHMSYSLYLVHGSIFHLMACVITHWPWALLHRREIYFVAGIPLAIAMAIPFFWLFERPFLMAPRAASATSERASNAALVNTLVAAIT